MSFTNNTDIKARTACPFTNSTDIKARTTCHLQTVLTCRLPLGQYSVTIQTFGISIHTPTKVTRLSWFISRSWKRGQHAFNTSKPEQNGAILADDIFKCTSLIENNGIQIQISLKCVPRTPIDNKPALVQVMVWRRTGDKPLPEPVMTQFSDAYMRHQGGWVNTSKSEQNCHPDPDDISYMFSYSITMTS